MNILSFLVTAVVAAETVYGPQVTPKASFGQLLATPTPTAVPAVLGTSTFIGPLMNLEVPTVTPTPIARQQVKSSVTIALLGDSMMDTLGPDAPALKSALKKLYPKTSVTVRNFGVGSTNIYYGIERITNGYSYLGKSYSSVVAANPDIVVIESFGYNPFGNDENAITTHWTLLAKAIDTIKANLPHTKIVIAATIAPNAQRFGDGALGLSFSTEDKWQRVITIKKYLENTVRFATGEHLPLADAYHASLLPDGNGNLLYINSGDHIHYSDRGRALMGGKIADAIRKNNLLAQ